MAFLLKASNSLDVLANDLCVQMQEDGFGVFQPVYIVTQTEGINNWLSLKIAERLGVAANLIFLKPNDLIFRAYKTIGGEQGNFLNRETLSWLIFHELGEEDFRNLFTEISGYYHAAAGSNDVKKMALAQKLADLFDQYQVYRADVIGSWNSSDTTTTEWQQYIWQKLRVKLGDELPDKTQMGTAIEQKMNNPEVAARLKQKMPVVYFFGISIITSFHLQILSSLAKTIAIKFLLLNPAPGDYWFEDMDEKRIAFLKRISKLPDDTESEGNPLLLSWGKLIQNTFSILFQEDEILNSYEELEAIIPVTGSLLHSLQHYISLNIKDPGTTFTEEQLLDHSIVINSCFSPLRETEAFYNFLVYLVHVKEEELLPRDVVVMVSDIDLYAPYIKAVFDTAPTKFSYSIADASSGTTDGIIDALHTLLQLRETNFTAEHIIRLLDHKFIREHASIKDIDLLRQLIEAANIRFGIKNSIEDESHYMSWTYGLQRIMYGIALSGEDAYEQGDEAFYPIDIVEGTRAHEAIRFVHFVQLLTENILQRKTKRKITDWVSYVENLLHTFICPADNTDEEYISLVEKLAACNEASVNFDEEIAYEVFLQNFDAGMAAEPRTQDFIRGGITFCSLIPMRSVPFKVVAMMGLNANSFPRKDKAISFDLMTKEKRKGDRSIKENDKHLFLETLLSAGEYFYISYVGQSIVSNTALPASALVDELVNYIRNNSSDDVKSTCPVYQQPLQSHSRRYLNNMPGIYSYLGLKEKSETEIFTNANDPFQLPSEISLHKFIKFLVEPIAGYYNEVLNVKYEDPDLSLPETEIFETDSLQNWTLKNELLHLQHEEIEAWESRQKKTGSLPLKNAGSLVVTNVVEDIKNVKEIFDKLTAGLQPGVTEISLQLNELYLSGTIENVYGENIISISFSKVETKYLLRAYINWLLIRAMDLPLGLVFISALQENAYEAKPLLKEEALLKLEAIFNLYKKGHEEMICFSNKLKLDITGLAENDPDVYANAWDKLFNNYAFPCDDPYLLRSRKTGFFDNNEESFNEYVKVMLLPLLDFLPEYFA